MRKRAALLLLLLGCGPRVPAACEVMCAEAADLYGGCLQGWGVDWAAAGYADRDDFLRACDTWAWQQVLLEQDAGLPGATEATCARRAERFEGGTCEDFTGTDWSAGPS